MTILNVVTQIFHQITVVENVHVCVYYNLSRCVNNMIVYSEIAFFEATIEDL